MADLTKQAPGERHEPVVPDPATVTYFQKGESVSMTPAKDKETSARRSKRVLPCGSNMPSTSTARKALFQGPGHQDQIAQHLLIDSYETLTLPTIKELLPDKDPQQEPWSYKVGTAPKESPDERREASSLEDKNNGFGGKGRP